MRQAIAKALMKGARFFARGYDGAERSYGSADLPWGRKASQDEDRYITGPDREILRQKLLDMRRNVPMVKGVCDRFCDFVVGPNGLQVEAQTDSTAWNDESEGYWTDWCRRCDVTGRWPFRKIQRGMVDARLWAGESFPMFTTDGRIQALEAERIRHPFGEVESATVFDGMSLAGPVVKSWYVADRDDQGEFNAKLGRWVAAENIYHFGSPWRFDMIRALPELAAGVNVMTDVGQISAFTLASMKKQSMIAGYTNTEGGSDMMGTRGSGSKETKSAAGVMTQKLDGAGLILRALPGEEFTMAQPATPNPNLEGHLVFNLRQFCSTSGMPYEVAMMDSTRGNLSQNKAVRELFGRVVETWQLDLADFVRYVWAWQMAYAIRTKQIGPAPVKRGRSQWDRIDVQAPPSTWADPADSAETDIKNMVAGNTLHRTVLGRRGISDFKKHIRSLALEEQIVQQTAAEFKISPESIRNRQISGNAPGGSSAAPNPEPKGTP